MDLSSLLARLNGSANTQNQAAPNQSAQSGDNQNTHYQPPSVSSPLSSPPVHGQEPPRQPQDIISAKTSAVNTPANEISGSSTFGNGPDLLGLLRSRQTSYQPTPAPQQASLPQVDTASYSNRPVSAADLVAGFARKSSSIGSISSPSVAAPSSSRPDLRGEASSSSTNPQDFLLKLLHQSKPESSSPSVKTVEPKVSPVPLASPSTNAFASQYLQQTILPGFTRASDPTAVLPQPVEQMTQISSLVQSSSGEIQSNENAILNPVFGQPSPKVAGFSPPQPAQKGNVFTYVNPFEQLSKASPVTGGKGAPPSSQPDTSSVEVKHVPHEKHGREPSHNITPAPAVKTRKIMPIDAPDSPPITSQPRETVSEAVDEVGEQVDKQVEEALANLQIGSKAQPAQIISAKTPSKPITRKDEDNAESPKSNDSFVAANWEDAEADKEQKTAKVYVMPMRPFVSIVLEKFEEPPVVIHDSKITNVARMRKDFDQLDRTLVACTSKFIVYAMKVGGLRLIRQDSGKFRPLYSDSQERIFNLSIARSRSGSGSTATASTSSAEKREVETVLGTGVKGTVFWAPLTNFAGGSNTPKHGAPSTDEDGGFIFPAVDTTDDQTSSGQLKTRVKPSTRSPDFFAYGRGKNIHIIWPLLARSKSYTNPKTKICDSEKYLRDDDLKISTGKAAKDFAFSADDTVIASLDKAGKLKFWDVRSLTKPEFKSELRAGVVAEVKTPIMTLNTTLPSEKSWPTSVMFVDREKPMTRGYALRYMIIGLKQNHTIQLWDLALSKPVQEINFPHSDESDAICSLAYNPRGSMLAVGHPTRNSIYLLNVSLPVYSPTAMNQAKYMSMIAEKNKNLPSVTSTVIFSSIREYSLGSRGLLRSLDLMIDPPTPDEQGNTAAGSILTLICMHSKGIFEFGITRETLGWSAEGKPVNQTDALEAKAVSLKELRQPIQDESPVVTESTAPSVASNKPESLEKAVVTQEAKPAATTAAALAPVAELTTGGAAKRDHESDKIKLATSAEKDKKKKKKAETKEAKGLAGAVGAASPAKAKKETSRSSQETDQDPEILETPARQSRRTLIIPREESNTTPDALKQLEMSMLTEVTRILNDQFGILYKRMADDKRASDAAGAAKQDAVLRLLSQTLQENFEGHVNKIITDAIKAQMKDFKESINSTVDRSITSTFSNSVKGTLPREISKTVESSLGNVLNDGGFIRGVSDAVGKQSANLLTKSFPVAFKEIAPVIQASVANASKQTAIEIEQRVNETIRHYETRHLQDSEKIDRLAGQINTLTTALRTVVTDQKDFQTEMRAFFAQSQQSQHRPSSAVQQQPIGRQIGHARDQSADTSRGAPLTSQHSFIQRRASPPQLTEEQKEVEVIRGHLEAGNFDEAFVQWLHSNRQGALFDDIFIHLGPRALEHATSLVVLSVTAAVSFSIQKNMKERLDWLDHAMSLLNPTNPEYESVLPKIMDVIVQRIDTALGQMSHGSANSSLYNRAMDTRQHAQIMRNQSSQSAARR